MAHLLYKRQRIKKLTPGSAFWGVVSPLKKNIECRSTTSDVGEYISVKFRLLKIFVKFL